MPLLPPSADRSAALSFVLAFSLLGCGSAAPEKVVVATPPGTPVPSGKASGEMTTAGEKHEWYFVPTARSPARITVTSKDLGLTVGLVNPFGNEEKKETCGDAGCTIGYDVDFGGRYTIRISSVDEARSAGRYTVQAVLGVDTPILLYAPVGNVRDIVE